MQDSTTITCWLDHLHLLMPPRHVVLVGAGNGSGRWVQWLARAEVPVVTLAEADETLKAPLQRATETLPGWRVRMQVVGPAAETVTFHVASMASESGLLEPESLRGLWPNLKTRQKQTRQALPLGDLLQDAETPADWLVLDCLPALPLLQGARPLLAGVQVLVLRTSLQAIDADPATPGPEALERELGGQGFRLMAVEAELHPAVGHALWVRTPGTAPDPAGLASRESADEHAAALAAQVAALTAEKAAAQALADERAQLLEQHTQAARQAQARIETLTAEHRQQAELIGQLTAASSAEGPMNADLARRFQLPEHESMELPRLRPKTAADAHKASAQQAQILALERQLQQSLVHLATAEQRHQAMEIELAKADAQLAIIKTLMLGEPIA